MTGDMLPPQSRIADRLWDLHAATLQDMAFDELVGFAAGQLEPLGPTITDLQSVAERLQTHQRDNARPPDQVPVATDDPFARYYR